MRDVASRLRFSLILVALVLSGPLSSLAQTRTTWSTAADIRSGSRGAMVGTVSEVLANSFTLVPDRDPQGATVRVTSDTIVTRYLGFGDTASEIFSGTSGFARLRVGDRVEVRGVGDTRNSIAAEELLLLGRNVTPPPSDETTARPGTIEGVIRSISSTANRVVLETDRREMFTVVGTGGTPVYYQGGTYRMENLEVGDRIRVEVESSSGEEVRARLINVVRDATPDQDLPQDRDRTVTSVLGRVTRIDSRAQTFRLQADRGQEILVDARFALDRAGNRFRLTDLQVGDRLEVSGQYDSADTFRADTIRFGGDPIVDDRDADEATDDLGGYSSVTLRGTLIGPFADNMIVVRDSTGDRFRVLLAPELIVRNRTGAYLPASRLRDGERVDVQAFRDRSGYYIAQTIRIR
jgi:hypothetical protein